MTQNARQLPGWVVDAGAGTVALHHAMAYDPAANLVGMGDFTAGQNIAMSAP